MNTSYNTLFNKDPQGFEFFIDLDCRVHHVCRYDKVQNTCILSFENVIKNSQKPDPFGGFNIKIFSENGTWKGSYLYVRNFEALMRNSRTFGELYRYYYPEYAV